MNRSVPFDLVIIGAGSGGIGAAIAAGRLGLKVLLVEKSSQLGGNAAVSGVSVWEMGVGGTGIPFDIYKALKQTPRSVGIYKFNRHCLWQDEHGKSQFPAGAELLIDPSLRYVDSLRRFGVRSLKEDESFVRKFWHGVPFEPSTYQKVVEKMLATKNVSIMKQTACVSAQGVGGKINSVTLSNGETVHATYFIDATDGGYLCRSCGCGTMFGQEAKEKFDEPDAPITPTENVNGVSLIYRVRPKNLHSIESLPDDIPESCWWRNKFPLTSCVQYPNGDFNMNMLPTMDGRDYLAWDPKSVFAECKRRSLAHWHYLQSSFPKFREYCREGEFLSLGVRETFRIEGEYILTEKDILQGISNQEHGDIIAISDHPMDLHGDERSGCTELSEPYGIPYGCLIPKGFKNILIASRSASFSSLAASSCRLSRTMMQLGQAAGSAIYLANKGQQNSLPEINVQELRDLLRSQHVQLDFPLNASEMAYLSEE